MYRLVMIYARVILFLQIFLDTISNPTAVSILRKEFKCMDSPKDSCKGDCLWSKEGKRSEPDYHIYLEINYPSRKMLFGLCLLFLNS